ncbi:hypothetical protein NKDENANG_02733 [Candidatus Entotheonellaceae bacterium PAL068K]
MPIPQIYAFTRYLSAKRTVDDRALNRQVWQRLVTWLTTATLRQPVRILELGAGTGAMAERLLRAGVLNQAIYTAVDADPDVTVQARKVVPPWAIEQGFQVTESEAGLRLQRPAQDVMLHFETIDLFDFIDRERQRQTWDLLIAHALLDLLDVATALPLLFSTLHAGGHFYFPITFDGVSILEPDIDPAYDAHIEALYHATMDQRVVRGKPCGDSRTGRHLFAHLRTVGADILAAGSSDWVVFAGPEGYPADEVYFLHYIIHTMQTALACHPALDPARFERWIRQRHAQVEDGTLVYIAHQLDIVGRLATLHSVT